MHLVYVDEVKFQPPIEPFFWLFGLAIDEDDISSVEDSLKEIANSCFGTSMLDRASEFHGVDIVQGKAAFKGRDLAERVEVFKKITDVIDGHPRIGRIQVQVDPARMKSREIERVAFMLLVERVDQLMRARRSKALLVVDHDKEFVEANVRGLSKFRDAGTDFAFGQKIERLVDTVHHTQSSHSRLLQLVDVYAYSMALKAKSPANYPKNEIVRHIKSLSNFCWPTKYKFWPPR